MSAADRLAEAAARVLRMWDDGAPEIVIGIESLRVELAAYRASPAPLTVTEEDVEACGIAILHNVTPGVPWYIASASAALDEYIKRKKGGGE